MTINSQTFLLLKNQVNQLLLWNHKIQWSILSQLTNIMRGKGGNILDNQYSMSAQKIRSILQESSVGESKMSQLTVSRNENSVMIKQYLNIARRLHYLFKQKQRSYSHIFISRVVHLTKTIKSNQMQSLRQVTLVCKESILRYKTLAFNKLYTNKFTSKSIEDKRNAGVKLLMSVLRQRLRWNLQICLQRLRIKNQNSNVIISKSQMLRTPKSPKQATTEQKDKEQQLSLNLITPLKQLVTYEKATFVNLTLTRLQSPLQIQIRKITSTRDLRGTQLLLMVLNNHIKAIVDLNNLTQINGSINGGGSSSRRSFNQKNNSAAMYEELGNQFFESDQQLNKLIILSNDIPKALGAIELAIKNYTARNYRFKNNKIIESRVKLLELILSLLRSSITQSSTSNTEIPPLLELKNQGTSFKQLQVSHVRLIVEELDHKVYELSTISQQIPQLQTFKRTLDLTMPEHNSYLTKIVDVLIQLHHKVNKLISRRPQKLLRQIQAVQQECLIIEIASSQFLTLLESETDVRLKPIYFDQRNNKSPDYFRKIQKNVVKLSEVIIECMALQQEAREKMLQVKSLIQVFWNLIAGMEEYEKQWKMYKNRDNKTNDEEQIIQMLELCLKFVNDRIDKMNEDFQIQRQTLIDGNNKNIQFLEEQMNKLARENQQQRAILTELEKQNQQFRDSLKDYELKYKDLLRKTEYDASDYQMRIGALEKKQKNYKDKIESLEAENEQKKVMITNITNDLKRAMKQSDTTWKTDQKNKDLEEIIEKLNLKIDSLQSELKNYRQDNDDLKQQKLQLERNNDLIMKKLDDANRRISQLQYQLQDLNHKNEREKSRLKQDIDELQRLNKKLNIEINSSYENKSREQEKKQNEYKTTVIKKDEKISQLSDKISDLNNKLNEMLNGYKNMEFELKRKQRNEQELNTRLKQTEGKNNNQYKDLLMNYEKNQIELNNALAQIQRCRNRTVPDLQKEIRKRQAIIAEMQKIINELDQKQSAILDQEQSKQLLQADNLNLRRLVDELEDKIRQKDLLLFSKQKEMENMLRQKDSRIKELQFSSNINNSKLNQVQSQLRIENDQKNRKIRELENRIRQLEAKQTSLQRDATRLREIQGKLINAERQSKNYKDELSKLESRMRAEIDQKNRKIKQLQNRIRQLQPKLVNAERQSNKLRQLQNKLKDAQRQNRSAKDSERENQRLKAENQRIKIENQRTKAENQRTKAENQRLKTTNQRKIKELQNQINNLRANSNNAKELDYALKDAKAKLDRMNDLEIELRNAKSNLSRLGLLQSQLRSTKDELNRLKQLDEQKMDLTNKIMRLEASLLEKNKIISDLEARIRNLQNQIRSQQAQLTRTKGLVDDLRNKQRQIAILQQEKASLEVNKANQGKITQCLKEIQYLKEKVRSLQDLIDIFTQQHGILQAKIKQYRLRQSNGSRDTGQKQKYQKLNSEYTKLLNQIRYKDEQIENLKRKIQQTKSIQMSPINKANLFQQNASKQKIQRLEKQNIQLNTLVQRYERQIRDLKDQLSSYKNKYNDQLKFWSDREKGLVQQNHILKTQLGSLQIKMKTIEGTNQGDKYYLRVEGQRLEQLIKRMESGNWNLTTKLDQILSNSRKIEETSQISSNNDFQKIIIQNKTLIQEIRRVMNEKQELSTVVQSYPNPEFLTEYAFRIIIYFSQIHPESPEGKCIWEQLQRIRLQNSGEQYFIILEQFTKFTLQQNAIQVYRRQLRDKAQELENLKAKLDIFFEQQLISKERTYEKTALTESRVAMFRQKLSSSSHSSIINR